MKGNWKKSIVYSVSGLVVVAGGAVLLFYPSSLLHPPTDPVPIDQGLVCVERNLSTQQPVQAVTSVRVVSVPQKKTKHSLPRGWEVDAQYWKNILSDREGGH